MSATKSVTIIDDFGVESTVSLPAHFEVCPRCEGHGTHLRSAIGEHAYTSEEFEEAFFDDEDRAEYFRHGGRYDVTCEECDGARVILEIDREACVSAEQRHALAALDAQDRDERQWRREVADEIAHGC